MPLRVESTGQKMLNMKSKQGLSWVYSGCDVGRYLIRSKVDLRLIGFPLQGSF